MSERRCRRCGRILTETDPAVLSGLCADCFGDLEEFMNGAPVLKWNPVKFRELTEEERARYEDVGIKTSGLTTTDSFMPEDGQRVLLTLKDGRLYYGTTHKDYLGYYLDSGISWEDDVLAWAVPDPYKPDEEGGAADGMSI